MNNKGLDINGFVATNITKENVADSFKPVLADAITALEILLGDNLHSIYLYGSVGRGTAVFGQSDLDLSVIVKTEISEETKQHLSDLESALCGKHESISKLEFDLGTIKETLVDNDYEWKFWLKHLCVCVWGEDLRDGIPRYRPALSVGLEMNKDICLRLLKVADMLSDDNFLSLGKSISKKMLRTHYSLYSEKDNSFYESLTEIANCLKLYEPDLAHQISCAFKMASGSITAKEEVLSMIHEYGDIVVLRFRECGGITI